MQAPGGLALDGEIGTPAVLPSGDGLPGGDAVYTFTVTATGDFDHDGDIEDDDLAHMIECMTGTQSSTTPSCNDADFDHDGDSDLVDFAYFQRCISGHNTPPPATCVP